MLLVQLGNGMYKGRFGFLGDIDELYGSEMKLLAELVIQLENGEEIVVELMKPAVPPITNTFSNIYDGEVMMLTLRCQTGHNPIAIPPIL